jgi:hypothetical protein
MATVLSISILTTSYRLRDATCAAPIPPCSPRSAHSVVHVLLRVLLPGPHHMQTESTRLPVSSKSAHLSMASTTQWQWCERHSVEESLDYQRRWLGVPSLTFNGRLAVAVLLLQKSLCCRICRFPGHVCNRKASISITRIHTYIIMRDNPLYAYPVLARW